MVDSKEKSRRTIFLDRPIAQKILTTANLAEAMAKFRKLQSKSDEPIRIQIDNIGGDYISALRFARYIEKSIVRTESVAHGQVNSAALLVYLGCKHRLITEDCVIVLHSLDHKFPVPRYLPGGRLPPNEYRKARKSQKDLEDFIYRRTDGKLPMEVIRAIMWEKDTIFSAESALDAGFAHEVVAKDWLR